MISVTGEASEGGSAALNWICARICTHGRGRSTQFQGGNPPRSFARIAGLAMERFERPQEGAKEIGERTKNKGEGPVVSQPLLPGASPLARHRNPLPAEGRS